MPEFQFIDASFSPEIGVAELVYAVDEGEALIETITFPDVSWPTDPARQEALLKALRLLHLIAGVSYYKATVSPEMHLGHGELDADLAEFLNDVYIQGLAEFAYVNDIDLASRIDFKALINAEKTTSPSNPDLPDRALVAMGGGKDSLVALSMLQHQGIEVQPVCIGQSSLIEDTTRAAGLPLLRIGREIAPRLAELNRAGAYNGHVPVTAINSAILLCAAILYGYRYIVFANERSADEATVHSTELGAVNHQYSKTSAFEAGFRRIIAGQISSDIEYFSMLRPFSELDIVRRFAELKKFHGVFSSCNRNFHIEGSRNTGRWCGNCPKCRFTALALAVFTTPEELIAIQGVDLLDDASQCDGFRALCRLGREKPFECVGEAGESRAALKALSANSAWQDHAVVQALAPELADLDVPELDDIFRASGRHFIPDHLVPKELASEH